MGESDSAGRSGKARARQDQLDLATWRSLDLTDNSFSGLMAEESILQWIEVGIREEMTTDN